MTFIGSNGQELPSGTGILLLRGTDFVEGGKIKRVGTAKFAMDTAVGKHTVACGLEAIQGFPETTDFLGTGLVTGVVEVNGIRNMDVDGIDIPPGIINRLASARLSLNATRSILSVKALVEGGNEVIFYQDHHGKRFCRIVRDKKSVDIPCSAKDGLFVIELRVAF